MRRILCAAIAACVLIGTNCAAQAPAAPALRAPDVRYEPTDMEVVQVKLRLGDVT